MPTEAVGIVTTAYNDATLIEAQLRYLDRYCRDDDYTIVVADNSYDEDASEAIRHHAWVAGARYLKTNSTWRGTSQSHIDSLLQSFEVVKHEYDFLAYLDHDLFPFGAFSVVELLEGYEAAGVPQAAQPHPDYTEYDPGGRFFWPGFFLVRNRPEYRDLYDLAGNFLRGFDSGGNTYKLIEHVGVERCLFVAEHHVRNPHFTLKPYDVYGEIVGRFMHFFNGSAWNIPDNAKQVERLESLYRLLAEKSG